jgi:hypothetical protein
VAVTPPVNFSMPWINFILNDWICYCQQSRSLLLPKPASGYIIAISSRDY